MGASVRDCGGGRLARMGRGDHGGTGKAGPASAVQKALTIHCTNLTHSMSQDCYQPVTLRADTLVPPSPKGRLAGVCSY